MPSVGLYVHVPFCPRKCGYCDFYSVVPSGDDVRRFIDAVLAEMDATLGSADHEAATIFVGGGTPTFLPAEELARLLDRLAERTRTHRPAEFTVEANPGTLDDTKTRLLRDHGVNRLSVGAQSFHERELLVLDRRHRPADIAATAERVHRAGFEHFNLDLIFGIPGQTLASWSDSLRRAVGLGADHVACYGLTYEEGTPLSAARRRGLIEPASEEHEARLYLAAGEQLAAAGFEHYEISNFARPQARCRHNLRYWMNEPVLGFGPGSASYLAGRRWRNVPDVAEYCRRIAAGLPVAFESEVLGPLARAGEAAMLQLRLTAGIDRAVFRAATGFDPHRLFAEAIARHGSAGLLEADDEHITLTPRGRLVADSVLADFVVPEDPSPGPTECHHEGACDRFRGQSEPEAPAT